MLCYQRMKNLSFCGYCLSLHFIKDGALTKQSTSRGPLHPAAHSMWQQSLGLVPKQRPLHCGAHTVLVTETHRRDELNGGHQCACVFIVCLSLCVSVYFCLWRETVSEEKEGRRRRERKYREEISETEQLGPHRSDIGPHLAPSSNLHTTCGMALRERREAALIRTRQSRNILGLCETGLSQRWPLSPLYWMSIGALLSLMMSCQKIQGP